MADKGYVIDIATFPNGKVYGPYDVTDYTVWEVDLTTGVKSGSKLTHTLKGNQILFIETISS